MPADRFALPVDAPAAPAYALPGEPEAAPEPAPLARNANRRRSRYWAPSRRVARRAAKAREVEHG